MQIRVTIARLWARVGIDQALLQPPFFQSLFLGTTNWLRCPAAVAGGVCVPSVSCLSKHRGGAGKLGLILRKERLSKDWILLVGYCITLILPLLRVIFCSKGAIDVVFFLVSVPRFVGTICLPVGFGIWESACSLAWCNEILTT